MRLPFLLLVDARTRMAAMVRAPQPARAIKAKGSKSRQRSVMCSTLLVPEAIRGLRPLNSHPLRGLPICRPRCGNLEALRRLSNPLRELGLDLLLDLEVGGRVMNLNNRVGRADLLADDAHEVRDLLVDRVGAWAALALDLA